MSDTKRAYENGKRDATLGLVQEALDEIKATLAALGAKLDGHMLRGVSLRTQVRVLWCAAGAIAAAVVGVVVKVVVS